MLKIFSYLPLLLVTATSCNGQRQTSLDVTVTEGTPIIPAAQPLIYTPQTDTSLTPKNIEVISTTVTSGPSGNVRCSLRDKAGNLWFGTWQGIYRYDGKSQTSSRAAFTVFTEKQAYGGYSLNRVYTIFEDNKGDFWFGTENGICRYDGKIFTTFPLPSAYSVMSIVQDKAGNIWFGTHGEGVYRYDGNSLAHFSEKEGLGRNVIQCILEDNAGTLWFGSRGGGICSFDGKSFTDFKAEEVVNNHIFCAFEDRKNNLLFGTVNAGVRRYDGKSFSDFLEPEGPCHTNISCMLEDKNGNLWFGSNTWGLCRYDAGQASFTNFTTKDGLCHNSIWTIVEDKAGEIWIGTRDGMCRYNGKTFTSL